MALIRYSEKHGPRVLLKAQGSICGQPNVLLWQKGCAGRRTCARGESTPWKGIEAVKAYNFQRCVGFFVVPRLVRVPLLLYLCCAKWIVWNSLGVFLHRRRRTTAQCLSTVIPISLWWCWNTSVTLKWFLCGMLAFCLLDCDLNISDMINTCHGENGTTNDHKRRMLVFLLLLFYVSVFMWIGQPPRCFFLFGWSEIILVMAPPIPSIWWQTHLLYGGNCGIMVWQRLPSEYGEAIKSNASMHVHMSW